jgi:hypothetical protein
MAIYRFRVSFENYEDVYREIDIRSDQTFEDFFYAIQQSIGFDHQHDASFYISNDQWKLGQLISSVPGKKDAIPLNKAVMHDWINDPHQKIYYTYDEKSDWSFYIELVRIMMKEDLRLTYPACVKVSGDSPAQYLRQPSPAKTQQDSNILDSLLKDMQVSTADEEEDEISETLLPEDDVTDDEDLTDGFSQDDEEDSDNEPLMDDDEQREY